MWLLAIPLALAALAGAVLGTRRMRQQKTTRFAGRTQLSDTDFARDYGAPDFDPSKVIAVRREVARVLEVPAELLRRDDHFDRELAPAQGWENWWDDGLAALKITGLKATPRRSLDWTRINTLDDLIRQACGTA